MRGDGRIFRQKGSSYWYFSYYLHGKEFRESSKSTDHDTAVRLLRRRLKEVGAAQLGARAFVGPKAERITVAALLQALREDKLRRGRRDPASEMQILKKDWDTRLAMTLTGPEIAKWQDRLLNEGYRPATVNRFSQLLGQAYRLGREQQSLMMTPVIKRLSETDNARTGIFTSTEFDRLLAELPVYLRDFARWGRLTGWRAGSIRSLRWEEVDEDKVLCRAQYSKDRTAHSMPLVGPLREIVDRRRAERKGEYVFSYPDGKPIGSYKMAWTTACCKAGVGKLVCPKCDEAVDAKRKCAKCKVKRKRTELKYVGRIFHDLRRTAATELRRSGVPEDVAMAITGHRTRSMFSRYNIVDLGDVRRAIEQREAYYENRLAEQPAASDRLQ
jgi:integrase